MRTVNLVCLLICYTCSTQAATGQEERFSITYRDALLSEALPLLSARSSVPIIFADELVEDLRITEDLHLVTIDQALQILLQNFDLSYIISPSSQYIITKRPVVPRMTISGVVLDDQNGEFLPYATVNIRGTKYRTRTDTNGHFTLANIPAVACSLQIQYIGYRFHRIAVSDTPPDTLFRIALNQVAIPGQEITVIGDSQEIIQIGSAAGQFAVSPHHFDILPMIGEKDLFRTLQFMPGIMTSTASASGVNIRGGASTENLILLDGMNMYHIGHGFGAVSAFPAEAIKDVRIFKGSFPSRFGGRLSGVMELTTKTGDMQKPRLKANANRVSAQGLLEIPFKGKGAGVLSVRASHSEALLHDQYRRVFQLSQLSYFTVVPDIKEEDLVPDNPKMDFLDILGKITLLPSDKDVVSISAYLGKDDLRFSEELGEANTTTGLNGLLGNNARWGNAGYSTRWYHRWNQQFRSTTQVSFSDFFTRSRSDVKREDGMVVGETVTDTLDFIENDVEEWRLRLDQQWQPANDHQIEFGLVLTNTRVRFADQLFELDLDAPLTTFYAEDTYAIHPAIRLTAGYRGNYYIPMKAWHHEPRLAIEMQVGDHTTWKGAWGKTFQYVMAAPDPGQESTGLITWVQADGDKLQPSSAEHSILGLRYSHSMFQFDVEGYYKRLRNIPDLNGDFFSQNVEATILQNNGSVRGIDMILQRTIGPVNSWVSYGYSRGRMHPNTGGKSFPRDQDRPHTLKLVGAFRLRGWTFSGTWQFSNGTPYTIPELNQTPSLDDEDTAFFLSTQNNRNARRLPAVHRLDLSASRSLTYHRIKGKIGFSVFNVYNRENVWSRAFALRNNSLAPVDIKMLGVTPTVFVELGF